MPSLSARFSEPAYAAMRFVLALVYMTHGVQKIFGVFGGHVVPIASRLWAAGIIEIVCGPLIALGVATRWAAFVASGEMAFAYFLGHAPRGGLPIQNGGELAVVFCFAFLYIAARGGGRYSISG